MKALSEELPRALQGDYRLFSCKKANERGAAYLCEHRGGGRQVLVKIASVPEEAQCLKNEYEILKRLEAERDPAAARMPRAVECRVCAGETILVREYIAGQSMEDYVESEPARPGIRREIALGCVISVLEQLRVLHRLRPPVIHRDVKPQNVILDEQGGFHLIDLGIARTPRKDGEADTQILGTLLTAPPEQYGFRQTDARSDIYAAGILLRYCLTQEYGEGADEAIDADLRRIVRRATQFDPQMRYQRAEDMLAALRKAAGNAPARRLRLAIVLAGLLLLLSVILGGLTFFRSNRSYTFREPLIEQAVRLALDKPEGPIQARELAKVTSIHIFGRQIYDDDSRFSFLGEFVFPLGDAIKGKGLWQQNGEIVCLNDLKALPNLREVCLYRQNISDLSPLRGMKLRGLGIGYNPVTDLSPLKGSETLEYLNVSCLDLADTDVIATLPRLRSLCLSATSIESLAGLERLPLEELNIADMPLADDVSLERLSSLKKLTVSQLRPAPLAHLSQLPLEELHVSNARGVSPRDLEILPDLIRLEYRTEESARIGGTPFSFPKLETLILKGVEADSLFCLSSLAALRTLGIYEVACADYRGLEALDRLETVFATADQAAALEKLYPGHEWAIVVAQ